ncbi:MAG TPA: hypothetical protein VFQ25_09435 [Ktedonobacterales bacterium]|nr:hypothetical protein [Ktedonobacterales bacterium]
MIDIRNGRRGLTPSQDPLELEARSDAGPPMTLPEHGRLRIRPGDDETDGDHVQRADEREPPATVERYTAPAPVTAHASDRTLHHAMPPRV